MPKPDQGWTSLTSTNAWGQANDMMSSGLTMQQARPVLQARRFATACSHPACRVGETLRMNARHEQQPPGA